MSKKLRIVSVIAVLAMVLLLAEFVFFKYSAIKIIKYLILMAALYIIAIIDGQKRIIPNRILLLLIAVRLILFAAEFFVYKDAAMTIYVSSFFGALIGFVIMGICYLVSKGGMGAGDVKLFFVMGLFLGPRVIMAALFLSTLVAAIYSIVLLVRKKTGMKDTLPFGPFIFIGTLIAMGMGF